MLVGLRIVNLLYKHDAAVKANFLCNISLFFTGPPSVADRFCVEKWNTEGAGFISRFRFSS